MVQKNPSIAVYRLKVTLQYIDPPIIRRIVVPNTMALDELHVTIQVAMGWQNYHLHAFIIDEKQYSIPEMTEFDDHIDESTVRLGGIPLQVGDHFFYSYDFGDDWRHLIEVEAEEPYGAEISYPVCVDAVRACPPEDVGGPWGYEEFLAAVTDEQHPEHEEMLSWAGGDFDPEKTDLNMINGTLEEFFYGKRWTIRSFK